MAMRRPAAAPRSASPAFSNCGAAQRCNEQQSQGACSAAAPSAEALADFQSSCNPVGSLAEPGTLNAKPGSASSAAPTDAAAVSEFASLRKADLMARRRPWASKRGTKSMQRLHPLGGLCPRSCEIASGTPLPQERKVWMTSLELQVIVSVDLFRTDSNSMTM